MRLELPVYTLLCSVCTGCTGLLNESGDCAGDLSTKHFVRVSHFFFGGLVRADSSISFCQPFLELLLGPHVMSPKHMTSVSSSKLQYVMFVVE